MSSAWTARDGDRDTALPHVPQLPGPALGSPSPGCARQCWIWGETRHQGLDLLPLQKAAGEFQPSLIRADGKVSAGLWFCFLFVLISLFPRFCFMESGLFPGGKPHWWEKQAVRTLSVAESAAETVSFAQQLLLEKSLCTGNVFRKSPTHTSSAPALSTARASRAS